MKKPYRPERSSRPARSQPKRTVNKSSHAKPSHAPRAPKIGFPTAWPWLVDEAIPTYVKQTYSPRETWKSKPFTPDDARFFFKGIEELSELFTEERPKKVPEYFNHPKYRSAYLLYFLPLQMAKFVSAFQLHLGGLEAALDHAKKQGVMRVADLGSGPGTASLALLLTLLSVELEDGEELPPVELHWVDTNALIMEDGKVLAEQIASQFPKLRGKITVHLHLTQWWKAVPALPNDLSLVLLGNVLNEAAVVRPDRHGKSYRHDSRDDQPEGLNDSDTEASSHQDQDEEDPREPTLPRSWIELFSKASGGGVLFVEPAFKQASQLLSRLRDQVLAAEIVEDESSSIWGPCLHSGRCPLAMGKDWCHFSIPADIPGRWFRQFSIGLGSERQWLKFSYLWFASQKYRAEPSNPDIRRIISDPLKQFSERQGGEADYLICEPERPGRITIPLREKFFRGDLVPYKRR